MLLGFYKQFVEPIQLGSKVFTLRKWRKIQPKIGETLYMYTGGYNAGRTLISNKEKLLSVQRVRLSIQRLAFTFLIKISIDGKALTFSQISEFCRYDGFKSEEEWAKHWLGKKQRIGALMQLFHWTDLKY